MKKEYRNVFKTLPKQTFNEFLNESIQKEKEVINEAKLLLRNSGYRVITEGKLSKFITGAALSLGLITNVMAKDFNAQAATSTYASKTANTLMLSKRLQKDYNIENNVQLTDKIVWNIADSVSTKLAKRMTDEDKYTIDDLIELPEWENAVEFYKILMNQDINLANMFSRRLDKALTKSLSIAPNIQRFVG